jgi:hypothetical protein
VIVADTNFPSEKNFEVENFQLLTMIFSENFLSVQGKYIDIAQLLGCFTVGLYTPRMHLALRK